MKKVVIVGAGPAGIFTALLISEKSKDVSIEIIEKEAKIGKKLRATGNGHANILNLNLTPEFYNPKSSLIKSVLNYFDVSDCLKTFEKWEIPTLNKENLVYPLCYHAPSFTNQLNKLLEQNNIKTLLGTSLMDYKVEDNQISVFTSNGTIICDHLIIAAGGKASPKLGSDGKVINILKQHGYPISPLKPGLTSIKIHEKLHPSIEGVRHKARVTLLDNAGEKIYQEDGEVLFKKDQLSGICIFNICSVIKWMNVKHPKIHIDLFPGLDLSKILTKSTQNEAILELPLLEEVASQAKKHNMPLDKAVHNLTYLFKESGSFENSQITIGGINETAVDINLESRLEPRVHFVGEILDVDGLCGGYNLSWCMLSALQVSRSF